MELTEQLRELYRNTADSLKGHARRVFFAGVVRALGPGGQRLAEREFGWSRHTIRKGEHELRTGIECLPATHLTGQKPIEVRMPQLPGDIRDVVDSQSQADPRFETTRLYRRLTVQQVVDRLIDEKGYAERDLPSNETIRVLLHKLDYAPGKVQKAKPKKRSRRQTRSSTTSTK